MISSEWLAVAKDVEYSLVQVLHKDKKIYYIIASDMVEEFMMYKFFVKYVVVDTFSSDELSGLECINPLNYNKTVKIIQSSKRNIIIDKKNTSGIRIVSSGHTYLDYLKSEYLLIAQDLKITIIDSEDSMTPESEEEIQFYINQLISFKEKLLLELDRFADKIKLLNDELEGGEKDDD